MAKASLIPEPVKTSFHPGVFALDEFSRIVAASDGAIAAAGLLGEYLRPATGYMFPVVGDVEGAVGDIVLREKGLTQEDEFGFVSERYTIEVEEDGVTLEADNPTGLLRAIQTFRQLLPAEIYSAKVRKAAWEAPCVTLEDAPKYRWRGMHLDVSRHVFSTGEVCRYVELLAQHKFNLFHWHLTDDQGWRIEIAKYPKLTEVGAFRDGTLIGSQLQKPYRCDHKRYGGFYTAKDVKTVVAFAARRGITVVPEIDMPGHMQAAVAAYPELGNNPSAQLSVRWLWGISQNILNPGPEALKFCRNVLTEVLKLFPSKFIHVGGDEAAKYEWENSVYANELMLRCHLPDADALQGRFMGEIGKFLRKKNRILIGWDEILECGLSEGAAVMSWRGDEAVKESARIGHYAVNSNKKYTYFDYPDLTLEKVYEFTPAPKGMNDEETRFVLGGQGQVWTEYMPNFRKVEFMAFPRAAALAERLWSPAGKCTFADFTKRMDTHARRLAAEKVNAKPLR
ncbi:MAG: beta-N-acetylhexosaminidase [Victivallaceae bacterium]|nr:beta-N-acetylhexosaminidase [Victivallaceae bacterium]